jgi:hypothetical protein
LDRGAQGHCGRHDKLFVSAPAGSSAQGLVLHHGAVLFHDGVKDFGGDGRVGLSVGPLLEAGDGSVESLEEFIAGGGVIEVAAEIGANLLLQVDVNVSGQGRQLFEAGGRGRF